jgi:phenylpropionate dioxygenase-like ring-hydroxylating dioxygenase large terminal subunit
MMTSLTEHNRTFPLNAWYVAAWDHEVGRSLLARTIGGKRLVLYRRQDDKPVALEDACWHRLAPLSLGRIDGDAVVCPYHGLKFNSVGRCIYMPSQDTINPAATVRTYPLVQRHRYIWIWLGDPAQADPDKIPDLHWNDHPDWTADGETLALACNYRLVIDNLMDLTHETFIHTTSIGNQAVAETPFETTHDDAGVTVTRWMLDIESPPFLKRQYGREGNVDRWQIIRFTPPSTIVIDVGVAKAGSGAPKGDRSEGFTGYVINSITPETENSCHYFWSYARNFARGDQRWTTELRRGLDRVFKEDQVVLEAQEREMKARPEKRFYELNIDAGSMWARKSIDQMLQAEAASRTPPDVVSRIEGTGFSRRTPPKAKQAT